MSEKEVIDGQVVETVVVPDHQDTDKVEVVVTNSDGTPDTIVTVNADATDAVEVAPEVPTVEAPVPEPVVAEEVPAPVEVVTN